VQVERMVAAERGDKQAALALMTDGSASALFAGAFMGRLEAGRHLQGWGALPLGLTPHPALARRIETLAAAAAAFTGAEEDESSDSDEDEDDDDCSSDGAAEGHDLMQAMRAGRMMEMAAGLIG
jgi:hypothetical protein